MNLDHWLAYSRVCGYAFVYAAPAFPNPVWAWLACLGYALITIANTLDGL